MARIKQSFMPILHLPFYQRGHYQSDIEMLSADEGLRLADIEVARAEREPVESPLGCECPGSCGWCLYFRKNPADDEIDDWADLN